MGTLTNYWKRRYKRVTSLALKEEYLQRWSMHAKNYKELIEQSKKESWRVFLKLQNKETAWSQAYRLCKKLNITPPTTITKPNGDITQNSEETAHLLLSSFFPDDDENNDTDPHQHIRRLAKNYEHPTSHEDPPFTQEEVGLIIGSQKDNKAPGEDAISANILKVVFETTSTMITSLYNTCLRLYLLFENNFNTVKYKTTKQNLLLI